VAIEYQLVIGLRDTLKTIESLGIVEIDSFETVVTEETPAPTSDVEDEGTSASEVPSPLYRFTILTTLIGEVQP
jgi:hypothetical protein